MAYANSIKFGTLTLGGVSGANSIQNISRNKVPGTAKQLLNNIVTFIPVPGKAKEWQIAISGKLLGANRDSDYSTLNGYDNGQVRYYDDGKINGDFIIEALNFADASNRAVEYLYTMTIRQA